jgi:hypothetical protein
LLAGRNYVGDFYITGVVLHTREMRTAYLWTIMETGQWVDGDLYNGRIVLLQQLCFKNLY